MNTCPKCKGEMEEGILVKNRPYGGKVAWASGIGVFVFKNKKDIAIYRCKNCGYLESYAK